MNNSTLPVLDAATRDDVASISAKDDLRDEEPDTSAPTFYKDTDGWRKFINEPLIDWGRNPDKFGDDDIELPSKSLITFALKYAMFLRDIGWASPSRVTMNGDGGITFERKWGPYYQMLEFDKDGSVELITFENAKLVNRSELPRSVPKRQR